MSMFINRKDEIKKLIEIYNSKKPELVLLYGRRRVGKSRLLIESIKNYDALYLLADMSENILDVLSSQIKKEFVKFTNWDDFFEFIIKSKYKIIIIDEFQYLYNVDKAWLTILQRWWEKIKESDKKIILCGSILSTIYKIGIGYGSALYGRKTREMDITSLKFESVYEFLRNYNILDSIESYFILGGIPRYLEEFDTSQSVDYNIKKKIIEKTSFLYNEPMNLLFEEFRDSTPYISIILAITEGKTKFNEISDYSRISTNKLPKYLYTLERVKIIAKEYPVVGKKIRSKSTHYTLIDNFYRFWFKFIFPNKSQIELGLKEEVFKDIRKNLNSFFGPVFEKLCVEVVLKSNILMISKIGRWWHKDKEIDIVAIDDSKKEILFCECKWKEKVSAESVMKDLMEKSRSVNYERNKEIFVVFAKSFKKKINEFENRKVYCFDLKDIEKIMNK